MKKKLICLILAIAFTASILAGCDVFPTNSQRDGEQIVIEVNYKGYKGTVKKSRLYNAFINLYNSYGSSYSAEYLMNYVVEQQSMNQLLVLEAKSRELDKLTDAEEAKAIEAANKAYAELLETYKEGIETERASGSATASTTESATASATATARPTPTPTPTPSFDPDASVDMPTKAIDDPAPTTTIDKLALERLIKVMKDNNYGYEDILKEQRETVYIDKLKETLYKDAETLVNDAAINAKYNEMLATQKENYAKDDKAYGTQLKGNDYAIIYHPTENYGFVKNLLINFSKEAQEEYDNAKESGNYTEEALELLLEKLHGEMTVDWYGEDGKTSDDETAEENLSINEFMNRVVNLVNAQETEAAKIQKFIDLIFAYGDDPGMFNNENDYFVSPVDDENSWVEDFRNVSQVLIAGDGSERYAEYKSNILPLDVADKKTGLLSMGYAGSTYGMHLIMVTYIPALNADENGVVGLDTVVNYLNGKTLKDLISDNLKEEQKSAAYNEFAAKLYEENKDDNVKVYNGRFKNIIDSFTVA